MPTSTREKAEQAFRRLLVEGQNGGQAKVDALVALAQRTVFIPTWAARNGEMRTLVNSAGDTALPIFTGEEELEVAGRRYGWAIADGSVPYEEVGAREAMRRVVRDRMKCLVIDIAAEHALEAAREELAPLVTSATKSDSEGPFAAVGRITSTMLEATRRSQTPAPGALDAIAAAALGGTSSSSRAEVSRAPLRDEITRPAIPENGTRPPSRPDFPRPETPTGRSAILPDADATGMQRRITPLAVAAATATEPFQPHFAPVLEEPSDEALDELAAVLREYPEVEWGTLCLYARTEDESTLCAAIRVEPAYRARVGEIGWKLASAGLTHGLAFELVLVDDPKLVQEARHVGLAFFPWKRRRSSSSG